MYLRSPLNYIGGKYKLLGQILPLFPKNIDTFYDLFAGGLNVSLNVTARSIVAYEIMTPLVDLYRFWYKTSTSIVLNKISATIGKFQLSSSNQAGYNTLRAEYNTTRDPLLLFVLICYSFNHQVRFNSRLEFNSPFGRDRSKFNDNISENLVSTISAIHQKKISFRAKSCLSLPVSRLNSDAFLYADPPYLITTAAYNDGKRGFEGWNMEKEQKLLALLDKANAKGLKFALSNAIENKGRVNSLLLAWASKYKIHEMAASYANSSYNANRLGTREVLITNY